MEAEAWPTRGHRSQKTTSISREVIAAHLPPELIIQGWIYKQGEQKGIEKGRAEGGPLGRSGRPSRRLSPRARYV